MSDIILKVENLSQHFKIKGGYLKAVDGVSFEIERGEVFGLVGESGCGKTTLGRALVGLYMPTYGKVYFNDELVLCGKNEKIKIDPTAKKQAQKAIQMIFQDPISSLNPRMTVREIVAEGLKIRGEKDGAKIDELVKNTLALVGLSPTHLGRYPHEFSGGQRQRIGIARSIILNPDLIIADEPISALDVSIQAQVINLLNDLKRTLNLTILFIAHDLAVVKYFSDRIGVMYFGKIVELSHKAELFENPLHPYTMSLLAAIPIPDPITEKNRKRAEQFECVISPDMRLNEIRTGHFVLCTDEQAQKLRKGEIVNWNEGGNMTVDGLGESVAQTKTDGYPSNAGQVGEHNGEAMPVDGTADKLDAGEILSPNDNIEVDK